MTYKNPTLLKAALWGLAVVCLLLPACKKTATFTIEGNIAGADNELLLLEKPDFSGRWITIDSVRTSNSGKFKMQNESPAYSEVFRLRMGSRFIYIPVDSVETIKLTSTEKTYGTDFTLEGSEQASMMAKFEKEAAAAVASKTIQNADFKRGVYQKYIHDTKASILSYFILTRTFNDYPLFNPEDEQDLKYITAVATAYSQYAPDDPRTKMLEQIALKGLRAKNSRSGNPNALVAEELKLIDIELPDENNVARKLSTVASQGKPTVLVFSVLTHKDSPEFNVELAKLANSRGLNIYDVSMDPDRYQWRDAAVNLPWTTVYEGESSAAAAQYNVSVLPTFFIINAKGELVDRASDFDELRIKLSKLGY